MGGTGTAGEGSVQKVLLCQKRLQLFTLPTVKFCMSDHIVIYLIQNMFIGFLTSVNYR